MDTFFISHGSPTLSIDDSLPARHFLKSWQDQIFTSRPNSILIISGHWETSVPTINVVDRNDTIYDFYGFPRSMYQVIIIICLFIYSNTSSTYYLYMRILSLRSTKKKMDN